MNGQVSHTASDSVNVQLLRQMYDMNELLILQLDLSIYTTAAQNDCSEFWVRLERIKARRQENEQVNRGALEMPA